VSLSRPASAREGSRDGRPLGPQAAPSGGLPPQLPGAPVVSRKLASGAAPLPRPQSHDALGPDNEVMLRPLSTEEVKDRNARAVSFFQSAQAINQRSRSVEDTSHILAS
ncbi:unnamed protein product, partial [Polarella glacialis]